MMMNNESTALGVQGVVDSIERLHRDPPAEYDTTAWSVMQKDGEKVLIECAVVSCPACGERAYWKAGVAACSHCQERRRLVG
jgi:hypothetical protein